MKVRSLLVVLACALALLGASATGLNDAGMAAYARGDFVEAERLFGAAVRQAPREPLFHYHRGAALTRLGRLGQAEVAYRAALRLGPAPELRRAINEALQEVKATAPAKAPQRDTTSVRLTPMAGGWVTEVVLNDRRTARFLVDTGAAISAVTPALAEELGIDPGRRPRILTLQTAAGLTKGPLVTIPAIRVGDVEARDVAGVIHDLWPGLDGILGNTFLGRYKVTLHPDTGTLFLDAR